MSEIATDAAAMSAATTGPSTPNVMNIERPTTKAEWTFIGVGAACVVLVAVFGAALAWTPWAKILDALPVDKLHELVPMLMRVIWFLGAALLILCVCIALMILALVSPTVGHVSAHAGPDGAQITVDGGLKGPPAGQ